MLRDGSWSEVQFSALLFGLLAVAAAYLIASVCGRTETTTLVLAGGWHRIYFRPYSL